MITPKEALTESREKLETELKEAEERVDNALRAYSGLQPIHLSETYISKNYRVVNLLEDKYKANGWFVARTSWRNETALSFSERR